MTLILTQITKHGIIHASDSNVTGDLNGQEYFAREAKKTFELPFVNAGLTVAGAATVAGVRMEVWMRNFIDWQAHVPDLRLSDFAENLRNALESDLLSEEKDMGTFVHIAGYVKEGNHYHPEFWFVRNVHSLDNQTGEYDDISHDFKAEEQFWNRDWPKDRPIFEFQSRDYQLYANGYYTGRISYMMLLRGLKDIIGGILFLIM